MPTTSLSSNRPSVRTAAGAILFHADRLLIVKPTYRDYWMFPGGQSVPNESPRQTCRREIREELGLDIEPGQLLCLDYVSGARWADLPREELVFFFAGGALLQ